MGDLISEKNLIFAPNLETIICLSLCLIFAILFIIVGIIAKHADETKAPKGLLFLADWAVEKIDGFTAENMGEGFENFGGILLPIILFCFTNLVIGITGLPTPMAYLPVPLSLGLTTFLMIHITSIRYTKWKYFKRYVDPIPLFLPVNLLSMWAPLLSLTLRLFGNALSGYVLMNIVYYSLESLSTMIFGTFIPGDWSGIFIAPLIAPILHLYFDLFSALIQTMIFISLTTIFIGQEIPDEDEILSSDVKLIRKGGK